MGYTKKSEVPEVSYFNTKGPKGGSQQIKNMLTYFQDSESKNAVDEATITIDSYVKKVKNLPEVEGGYMTLGDWIDGITEDVKEETKKEIKEDDIKIFIETFQEYVDSKEEAVSKFQEKYPDYAERAGEFVEKYWKES